MSMNDWIMLIAIAVVTLAILGFAFRLATMQQNKRDGDS